MYTEFGAQIYEKRNQGKEGGLQSETVFPLTTRFSSLQFIPVCEHLVTSIIGGQEEESIILL